MPRKTNKIKTRKTVLLIVEGYTEKIYFSQLKFAENNQNVTITPRMAKHSSLLTILETAIQEAHTNIYDSIWCIFDRDVLLTSGISDVLNKKLDTAKSLNIQFADSLPAFEIWFLLHYTMPKQFYKNQEELINELKKYIVNYKKEIDWLSRTNLYVTLKSFLPTAIAHNKKLEQRNLKVPRDDTSMCNVYKLIQEIAVNNGANHT